jgi:ADP-heptose:LPS heptosyltransferase
MHIAAALGVPVVAVFGPTKLEWFGPRGAGHHVAIQDGYECRPCFDKCQFQVPGCIVHLPVSLVRDQLQLALDPILSGTASV